MTNLPNTTHGTTKMAITFEHVMQDRVDGWQDNIVLVRNLSTGSVYTASGQGQTMKSARSHARIVTARHSNLLRRQGYPGLTVLN